MTNKPDNLNPIEAALVELREAEAAKVFDQTPLDTGAVLGEWSSKTRDGLPFFARVLVPAAAIVLMVGVGSFMFRGEINGIRDRAKVDRLVALATPTYGATFSRCLSGPGARLATCDASDRDADGDVDLADFGAVQLAYAHPRR